MLGVSLFGTGPGNYYLMYGNNIRHHFSAIKNGGSFIITLDAAINPIGYNIQCDRVTGQPFNIPGDGKQYYIFKGGNFNEEGQCTQVMLYWVDTFINVSILLMDGRQPTRVNLPVAGAAGLPEAGAAGLPEAGAAGAAGAPGALRPSKLQQYAANPTMFAQMITHIKRRRLEASVAGNEESVRRFNATRAKLEKARRNLLTGLEE